MSLNPIETIQKCSECQNSFIYKSNTLDIPLELTCETCLSKLWQDENNEFID